MTSLYEHAGGEEAIHRLEEAFYGVSWPIRSCSRCSAEVGRTTSST
jgi:hypothetical protein